MGKLKINARCIVSQEQCERNVARAKTLGLPYVTERKRPPLAVLGGGRSIVNHLEEVLAFQGDCWAIGSAFRWWNAHGIDATFFSVHPSPLALANITGVSRALLATVTDPAVFAALSGLPVEVFDLEISGPTSATAIPHLALRMGYSDVTFYGCESSYDGETSHPYMDIGDEFCMRVTCGGKPFLTGAEFLMQAEFLAAMIRAAPHVFRERSGGLLRAMVESGGEYDVTHISRTLDAGIVRAA